MEDIHDIKLPLGWPVWVWVLLALGVVIIAVAIWLYVRQRIKASKVPPPPIPPGEMALKRLGELGAQQLPAKGEFKAYYFVLSDILRRYIEDRLHIRAPEMTTEEFLIKVKADEHMSSEHKNILRDFMDVSDMVKFAKHAPTVEDAAKSFNLVLHFVQETNNW